MNGAGVTVVKKEAAGRKGKPESLPAHTREAKLGSRSSSASVPTWRRKRGWSRAEKKVVMGDGAEWIWNLPQQHFPGASQIVDPFHARQHLMGPGTSALPRATPNAATPGSVSVWIGLRQKRWLDKRKIDKIVAFPPLHSNPGCRTEKKIRNKADYFATNAARMNHLEFRKQHLFDGSGVTEGGCKTVIGRRLKASGMF